MFYLNYFYILHSVNVFWGQPCNQKSCVSVSLIKQLVGIKQNAGKASVSIKTVYAMKEFYNFSLDIHAGFYW